MHANLSLQQSPPFSVPARFFISAPLFGLAAALVMLWYGPEIFTNRWTPELLAVTHFLTLGFLAMSMCGAMMQLMPVLMGIMIPRPIFFSSIIHASLFLGSASLGIAWLLHINTLFIIAMASLAFSFSVFILMATERLLRSKNQHATRGMMLLALLALFITAIFGLYLAMGYANQTWPLSRHLTDLHLSWGLLGWVALLIMAVAYQVIPMFQITDEYPVLHQRWIGWIVFVTLLTLSLTYFWPLTILNTITSALLATCLLTFAVTTLWVLQTRRRQLADLTMNFWQLAMISLIFLALTWLIPTLIQANTPIFLLGVLMIFGFAMSTVNGMMYKIFPFLIWLHLSTHNKNLRDQGKRESQVKVPHMRKIIPETAGLWQFRFHLASLILLALATNWPQWFYYPAALLFIISQLTLIFNLSNAVRFYNLKIIELELNIHPH
ncbi:MAG: hypothetical protein OEY66_00390 [Gammaproteobacteria bacterium]|nr:hypothetical protein [Gammaproteobacteria bacterium]